MPDRPTFVVVGAAWPGDCGGDPPRGRVRRPGGADRRGARPPRTNGRRCRSATCAASSRAGAGRAARRLVGRTTMSSAPRPPRAAAVEAGDRTVTLEDGEHVRFDRALVATGVREPAARGAGRRAGRGPPAAPRGRRRPPPCGGARCRQGRHRWDGIHRRRGRGVAAPAGGRGDRGGDLRDGAVPGPRARLGRVVEAIHRDHGVEMRFGETVERFEGDGRVERVVTRGGRVECDLSWSASAPTPGARSSTAGRRRASGCARVRAWRPTSRASSRPGDVVTQDHPVLRPGPGGALRQCDQDGGARGARDARHPGPFDDPHWFWSDQYEHEIQMGGVFVTEDMVVRGLARGPFVLRVLPGRGRGAPGLGQSRLAPRRPAVPAADPAPGWYAIRPIWRMPAWTCGPLCLRRRGRCTYS